MTTGRVVLVGGYYFRRDEGDPRHTFEIEADAAYDLKHAPATSVRGRSASPEHSR